MCLCLFYFFFVFLEDYNEHSALLLFGIVRDEAIIMLPYAIMVKHLFQVFSIMIYLLLQTE